MSTQKRILKSLPLETNPKGCTHVDVELYYSKGGMNYFNGRNEPRGLYLSASPLEKGDRFVKFSAWSGIKRHVKEMKAFSQKALDSFTPEDSEINELIQYVLEKNELSLKNMS